MNVLFINQSEISGGASIAAYSLLRGLWDQEIHVNLLAEHISSSISNMHVIQRKRLLEEISERVVRKIGLNYISIGNSFQLFRYPLYQEADILNFHNLHGGYFNYLALSKLTRNKPAVFTLHDMWSFTGHCTYSFDCDRWKTGCGKCPYPETYPAIACDNTSLEWKLKNWVYSRSHLAIVTPSKWLAKLAHQSMLNRFPIHHIPNGIDTKAYQPLEPQMCRPALGIPHNKKVLFFTAQNLKDPRKGGDLLLAAFNELPTTLKKDLILMTMGTGGEALAEAVDIPTMDLGYVGSDRLKAIAYSASTIFIAPTRADNLPIVLQESMACGTPMVSFSVGGVPELVRHGMTGLLAEPEDPADLSAKLIELLEDDTLRTKLSQNCRRIAVEEYSIELQAQRYITLYEEVIAGSKF